YYIPVTLRKITYSGCVYEHVKLTKDQAKQQAKENIWQFLKKLEEKGIQIVDKNVMIEFEENRCQVKGSITAMEKIGRYESAEIEKIDTGEETKEYESD
ncbi:MAG: sporulation protein YqfD, partial [Roseburia sp.]|nr:sporulation protein YqfD [Roseburia sp.]